MLEIPECLLEFVRFYDCIQILKKNGENVVVAVTIFGVEFPELFVRRFRERGIEAFGEGVAFFVGTWHYSSLPARPNVMN